MQISTLNGSSRWMLMILQVGASPEGTVNIIYPVDGPFVNSKHICHCIRNTSVSKTSLMYLVRLRTQDDAS